MLSRVRISQLPSLQLKQGFQNVGDDIHYTVIVTNTGNVILTNIDVTDPLTNLNETIPSLAPGASVQFTTTHSITQGDIDAGEVQNTATAAYTYAGEDYTEEDEVTVSAIQGPDLSITKSAAENRFPECRRCYSLYCHSNQHR